MKDILGVTLRSQRVSGAFWVVPGGFRAAENSRGFQGVPEGLEDISWGLKGFQGVPGDLRGNSYGPSRFQRGTLSQRLFRWFSESDGVSEAFQGSQL